MKNEISYLKFVKNSMFFYSFLIFWVLFTPKIFDYISKNSSFNNIQLISYIIWVTISIFILISFYKNLNGKIKLASNIKYKPKLLKINTQIYVVYKYFLLIFIISILLNIFLVLMIYFNINPKILIISAIFNFSDFIINKFNFILEVVFFVILILDIIIVIFRNKIFF